MKTRIFCKQLTALLLCITMLFSMMVKVTAVDEISNQDLGEAIEETATNAVSETDDAVKTSDTVTDDITETDDTLDSEEALQEITVDDEAQQENEVETEQENAEDEGMLQAQAAGLRTSVTDGDVTIDIDEYDENEGWENGASKDVTITVDFGYNSDPNKEVSITLPEGLKFTQFPVKSIDPAEETVNLQVEDTSVYRDSIETITYPQKQDYYPSYNGTLKYTFKDDVGKIELTIKVAVDETVYYGKKMFNGDVRDKDGNYEAIVVQASKDSSVIGIAKQKVYATHSISTGVTLALVSTPRTIAKGSTDSFYVDYERLIYRGAALNTAKYYKAFELTYSYLPELTYDHLTYNSITTSIYGTAPTVTDEPSSNKLVMKAENIYSPSNIHFDYWYFYFTARDADVGTYEST